MELKTWDAGTIIHIHPGGEAFVVEFTAPDGDALGVATVLASQTRTVPDAEG